jgi:hypothetical protein
MRIAQENMFSDFNNFSAYNITDKQYINYYGFNQNEVDWLIEKNEVYSDLSSRLQYWYNGYNVSDI